MSREWIRYDGVCNDCGNKGGIGFGPTTGFAGAASGKASKVQHDQQDFSLTRSTARSAIARTSHSSKFKMIRRPSLFHGGRPRPCLFCETWEPAGRTCLLIVCTNSGTFIHEYRSEATAGTVLSL